MGIAVEVEGRKPGKARSITVTSDKFGVEVDFLAPNAWADGSTEGFSLAQAVSHYEVYLIRNGSVVKSDLHVLGTKCRFKADKASGYKAKVRVIGHDTEYEAEDTEVGNATSEGITGADIEPGSIALTHYASGLRPIRIVTSLPGDLTGYIEGDLVVLNQSGNAGHGKLHRLVGGSWTRATDGVDIVADSVDTAQLRAGAVKANQIDADAVTATHLYAGAITSKHTITGASFLSSSQSQTGDYMAISSGLKERVEWRWRFSVPSWPPIPGADSLTAYLEANNASGDLRLWASGQIRSKVRHVFEAGIEQAANTHHEMSGNSIPAAPSSGHRSFHDNGTWKVKFGNGVVKNVATNA